MSRYWRCRRQSKGVVCNQLNLARKRLCTSCGKPRPKRKKPAHAAILDSMPYERWAEVYSERCGICGCEPSSSRRLDRDHDHRTGEPRGLLCHRCNRTLGSQIDPAWLRRALAYLERPAA
jgi:hypothetical protein